MIAREEAGRTLDLAMEVPIVETLYLVCWKLSKSRWEEQQLKNWKHTH